MTARRRNKIRRAIVLAAIALALIAGIGVLRSSDDAAVTLAQRIDGPQVVEAGETIEIAVKAQGEAVEVTVVSAHGVRVLRTRLAAGQGRLLLDGSFANIAGTVTISAPGAGGPVVHNVAIRPGEPSAVELFVESNTLRSRPTTDVIAVVVDNFGNPVADATTVQLVVTDTIGSARVLEATTRNGIADFSVVVPQSPTRLAIVGTSGQATSNVEFVERLGGEPTGIQLRLGQAEVPLVADGSAVHTITSGLVTDSSGHTVIEGTVVQLILDGPEGPGVISGRIEGGRLRASVMAPLRPGTVTVTPVIGQTRGDSLELVFAAAVQPFSAEVRSLNGGDTLHVGPVLAWHGGLAPDATTVTIDGQSYSLKDGVAVVPLSTGSRPDISVLGVEGTMQ